MSKDCLDKRWIQIIKTINRIASSEGWSIFNAEDRLQIQCIDELDRFPGDKEAYDFIIQQALNGSRFHVLALALDKMEVQHPCPVLLRLFSETQGFA